MNYDDAVTHAARNAAQVKGDKQPKVFINQMKQLVDDLPPRDELIEDLAGEFVDVVD